MNRRDKMQETKVIETIYRFGQLKNSLFTLLVDNESDQFILLPVSEWDICKAEKLSPYGMEKWMDGYETAEHQAQSTSIKPKDRDMEIDWSILQDIRAQIALSAARIPTNETNECGNAVYKCTICGNIGEIPIQIKHTKDCQTGKKMEVLNYYIREMGKLQPTIEGRMDK
jgi:hypothetical protein